MRVLMVNRADSRRSIGGDTVQMDKTRQALAKLGVSTAVSLADALSEEAAWRCDLVHLFNIQTAHESWRACEEVQRRKLPLVVSPIYWDPLPSWFREAPRKRRLWGWMRAAAGPKLGFACYAAWQRFRYPSQDCWNLQRRILLAAEAILPNSKAEADQLMADFRLPKERASRFTIVPNGVDRRLFEGRPTAAPVLPQAVESAGFVLQVGRLSPEKNPLGLIEALWDHPATIVFVGRPSSEAMEYFRLCVKRGEERGRVHFLDWMRHEDLPGIYASAAVHALPSWRETPGLASLEAAAAGCRVVSTSIGSAREYFGEDAWYCHPEDLDSIENAVRCALNQPRSDRLRRRVLDNYTWEAAAASTLGAYKKLSAVQ